MLETEWIASTSQPVYDRPPVYDMPPVYDHTSTERKVENVSALKSFLKSFLKLMKDEIALSMPRGIIN